MAANDDNKHARLTELAAWDRVCALSFNCDESHARFVRLYFTAKNAYDAGTSATGCSKGCRCPMAVLKAEAPAKP